MCFFAFYGILVLNVVAFCLYGIDKAKAARGRWRIPETTLFVIAIIGGAVGALMAMSLFHHKTQKKAFRYVIPVVAILHVLLVAYLVAEWFLKI